MYKLPILEVTKKRAVTYGPVTIFRAKKNGLPYLKTEVKWWRGINGIMIQIRGTRISFLFRRRTLGG